MAEKTEANQIFRQFAWHLAGTLAGAKAEKSGGRPRPAKTGTKRS